jgi:hypothetical protein
VTRSDFSYALTACRRGDKKITREGWNASGQWVCLSPGFTLGSKRVFSAAIRDQIDSQGEDGEFRPYLMLRAADGSFVPWQPTVSDVLADDWLVLD